MGYDKLTDCQQIDRNREFILFYNAIITSFVESVWSIKKKGGLLYPLAFTPPSVRLSGGGGRVGEANFY